MMSGSADDEHGHRHIGQSAHPLIGSSMRVTLSSVSKVFGRETVIRDLSRVFEPGSRTAILGPNGSGKSTLLQLIGGFSIPTKGTVTHERDGKAIEQEYVYKHISIAAPYMSLYEELSLREAIASHRRFKTLRGNLSFEEIARTALLEKHLDKPVRDLSSGMKQRLKLALAILSDTSLLLLDEPTSNLDTNGGAWFRKLLEQNIGERTLVVASNRQAEETFACSTSLEVAL
jgi:ABC-type multidrug transport system ATPase subunit